MKPIEISDRVASHRAPTKEKGEVAELATRILTLPGRATPLGDGSDSTGNRFVGGSLPRYGWIWWVCYLLVWAVTLSLGVVALMRIFHHDGTIYLTWINAFTRYVYLPAYLCVIWALWMRRWGLAAVGLSIVGCHLVWMTPDFVRDRRFDLPPSEVATVNLSPRVRIFFANVLAVNEDFGPLWSEIEQTDPDVIVLAECTRSAQRSLREAFFMTPFLIANPSLRSQRGEVVIFSKLPIRAEKQDWAAGRIVQTVDLGVGSQSLRLIGLHAPRPVNMPGYDYVGYYNKMVPLLTSQQGPLLIVGDFNATQYSLVYKQLEASGLRSAHEVRGRGWAATWPNGYWWLPPIRIDQAFLSPELECEQITEGWGAGSDHKPLIVNVRIRND